MVTQKIIKKALKNTVSSSIYARGMAYQQNDRVKEWHSEENSGDDTIIIAGKVRGSRTYQVVLEFNSEEEDFIDMTCTCPYGFICKHVVAVGLAFAESLEEEKQEKQLEPMDKTQARTKLAQLGLHVENLPDSLIEQLLTYQKPRKNPQKQKNLQIKRGFNPQDYYFTLEKYNDFTPTLHEKRYSYQQASINKLLQRADLTHSQRELLLYLKEENFSNNNNTSRPDPQKLFPLLVASGFPLYHYYSSYGNNQQLTIDLHPQKLHAEIVYEPFLNGYGKTRHDFFFRVSKEYTTNDRYYWHDKPFMVYDSCLVRNVDRENKLELHLITPLLVKLFSRLEPIITDYARRTIAGYQSRLTGEEIAQFDQLVADASTFLDLTSPPPSLVPRQAEKTPQQAFVVDFDNTAQTLRVAPVVDYGIHQQDVSESVYLSRTYQGNKLRRREIAEHPGTHMVMVADGMIHHAPIDEKKEIAFYRSLTKAALELGFTKTVKFQRKGEKPIMKFFAIEWPRLLAYANKHKYPILFPKDALPTEHELFRADFTTELDTDNDWLYFDVAVYCGEERVTLEKLSAFIESHERFWEKEDGTLVEIANRDALERLVKLLKSFHARENGGFEGKLHHAPELEYVMTSSKQYNAKRTESFTQFINRIQKGKPVKKVSLPEHLTSLLRTYQQEGIEWFYFLSSYRFAGILAVDMGLGKTLQTLSIISLEKISETPSIVVCPKTLLYNWKQEAAKFFPDLHVLVYDGTPKERQEKRDQINNYDLIITSYPVLKQDKAFFLTKKTRFHYVILDEAQFIKNHATKNAQIVKQLNTDYRLALTGTPLENSVSELWSLFDFLMPDFLGKIDQFTKNFHKPIMDQGDKQSLTHLRSKIQPFMLRRTKSEVLKELPPKIEQLSECQLTEEQNVLYQQILQKVRGDVFAAVKKKGFQSAQIHILAGLTKLRQACNHPALLIKDKDFRKYESAKLDLCLQLIEEVREGNRKVLIFSQFTSMLDIISATLQDNNLAHLYLSGKTKNRQELVDTFNTDPAIPVFLISLKAGGTGLNLTAADTVIIFDPWWNPSVENQAIDRTHRIGQTQSVNVYRLVTIGTIEEKIQALKHKKQQLFDSLIDESGDIFKKLTWDDVKELFAK